MKPTKIRQKTKRRKKNPQIRRSLRVKTQPKGIKIRSLSKDDLKSEIKNINSKLARVETLKKQGSRKKDKDAGKPEKTSVEIIKAKTIKLNPLLFPEDLEEDVYMFGIKNTQEELVFAMACPDAV